jgi:hypothetical protein
MKVLQVIHGYPMRYNAGSAVWTAWQSPVYLGITPQSSWVSVVTRRKKAGDISPAFTGEYFSWKQLARLRSCGDQDNVAKSLKPGW